VSCRASELPAARRDECLALHDGCPIGAEPPAYDESWGAILLRLRAAARAGRDTRDAEPLTAG